MAQDALKDIEREFNDRLHEARQQKMPFDIDMRESYFFAAPHRMRSVLSTTRPSKWKPVDAGELNQSFAFECCGDFPTIIANTFMPEAREWVVRKAPVGTQKDVKDRAENIAKEGTSLIFEAVEASNFYSEFGKSSNPDLAIGTIAMWIDRGRPGLPIVCRTVPIRELEINLDAEGEIDDRFISRWIRRRYLDRIFPNVALPAKISRKNRDTEDDRVNVTWGFWRYYDSQEEETWLHATTVEDAIVGSPVLVRGMGSCPLIVGRFNPGPEWAWGVGPMIQCLAEFRNLDEIAHGKIKNLDQILQPSVSWPDDSFANVEQGLESGYAYPIRPGTANDIKNIYQANPPDAAIYDRQDLEQRIKRLFFLDWPQQRGDTPPTATQWLDEMTMAQRRIGTPGLPFWREFVAGVFQRFEYLLERAGEIAPIIVPDQHGLGRKLTMRPYNPAEIAADQQDVAQASRFLGIVMPTFPEESKLKIDGGQTIEKFRAKMGVEDLIVMRSPQDIQAAMQQIQQLAAGRPGAPPAGAGQEPAGPPAPSAEAGPEPNQPVYQLRSTRL
jgi:hypothetical protein